METMKNKHITVKELIELLESEPNKDKPVYIYLLGSDDFLPLKAYDIDFDIDDRLDLNVDETQVKTYN